MPGKILQNLATFSQTLLATPIVGDKCPVAEG
jgi:hypothetical protein